MFQNFFFLYLINSSYPFHIFQSGKNIPQIRGQYSFFKYENSKDNFRYKSKSRKKFKNNLPYIVQDHHIIPKQFKNHKLLRNVKFDINSSNNLLIMPAKGNEKPIFLLSNVIYHKPHPQYNKMIHRHLDYILITAPFYDDQAYHVWLLLKDLETRILFHDHSLFP